MTKSDGVALSENEKAVPIANVPIARWPIGDLQLFKYQSQWFIPTVSVYVNSGCLHCPGWFKIKQVIASNVAQKVHTTSQSVQEVSYGTYSRSQSE